MKKKVCLLMTLIVLFFVYSSSVEAAYKELTCIYEGGNRHYSTMLVQNSSGQLKVYYDYGNGTDIDGDEWVAPTRFFLGSVENIEDIDFYNKDELLVRCPEYVTHDISWDGDAKEYVNKFFFSDEKRTWWLDYELVDSYNRLPRLDTQLLFTKDKIDEYNKIINNTEWSAKCTYFKEGSSYIYLYFNEDKYILIDESDLVFYSKAKFNLSDIWYIANEVEGCPPRLYKVIKSGVNQYDNFEAHYYFSEINGQEFISINPEVNFVPTVRPDPPFIIEDCDDLFGRDLINKINDVMDLVKIVVPILLIAFGIIDFTKAVFSGSVEDMLKCRKKFLKRIVAAILVFIAPIFINLILTLANEVWGNINPDTCIK